MTQSYSTAILNKYLAPEISAFTVFEAPDISEQYKEASHWIANHFLNSVFRSTFKNKFRQYAVNQLYRAQVAFTDYHEARVCTGEYLKSGRPDMPAIRAYFRALSRWESCLLNLQIFIDVMNKMKLELKDEPVFNADDGSLEQRAYSIANTIKHFGSDVAANRHEEDDTVPMWLTNTGFKTRTHELTYLELTKLVSDVATAANELQDPLIFTNPEA